MNASELNGKQKIKFQENYEFEADTKVDQGKMVLKEFFDLNV